MTGPQLARARQLADHSADRLGELLGVSGSTVLRNEDRRRITPYLQAAIMDSPIGPYYWALIRPWPRPRPIIHQPQPTRGQHGRSH